MKVSTKITICRVLGFMLLLVMLGAVGGMEVGAMSIGKGAVLAISSELVGAFLLWKGGVVRVR